MVQLMPLPPHHLLLHWHPDYFNLSGAAFDRPAVRRVVHHTYAPALAAPAWCTRRLSDWCPRTRRPHPWRLLLLLLASRRHRQLSTHHSPSTYEKKIARWQNRHKQDSMRLFSHRRSPHPREPRNGIVCCCLRAPRTMHCQWAWIRSFSFFQSINLLKYTHQTCMHQYR